MLLFERFVGALSPEEVEKIRAVKLTPVERKLLDKIVALRSESNGPNKDSDHLRTELGMSNGNLRYYSSVVLKKAYEALSPEGGIPLLRMLAMRGLIHNFKNEIREQEKNIDSTGLREYYLAAFELATSIVASNLDLDLCRSLGSKYLASINSHTQDDSTAIELRIKMAEFLQRFTMHPKSGRATWEFRKYLDGIPNRLNGSQHQYAQYAFADAECCYKYVVDPSSAAVKDILKRMIESLPAEITTLLPETREMLEYRLLQQCEHEGDPELVYQTLEEFFSKPRIDLPAKYYLYLGYYALLTGRFNRARECFNLIAPQVLTNPPTITTISYYELLTSYFLLDNQLTKAQETLDQALIVHDELGRPTVYEVYLRNLQLTYYAMTGDCEFCLRLADRNLDWLRKGGHDINEGWATAYHIIVREMISAHTLRQPPSPKVIARRERFKKTGPDGLIVIFLNRLQELCDTK